VVAGEGLEPPTPGL